VGKRSVLFGSELYLRACCFIEGYVNSKGKVALGNSNSNSNSNGNSNSKSNSNSSLPVAPGSYVVTCFLSPFGTQNFELFNSFPENFYTPHICQN
jgi:hypothetical protein